MLVQANCVKEYLASGAGQLEMQAGRSALIKRVIVNSPTDDAYITLRVDRKTVGFYRVLGKSGGHLNIAEAGYHNKNLMQFLTDNGVNVTIPLAEGQTLSFVLSAGTANVLVVYDLRSADDIKAVLHNGSDSKTFTFVQYMDASVAPAASGDTELDVSLSPAEFPDFPCGRVVPPKHTIDILGIVGCPVGDAADGSNYIVSDYIKFVKDREVLFNEDRNGLIFRNRRPINYGPQYHPTMTQIGPCVPIDVDEGHIPLADAMLFDPVMRFVSGAELLVYLSTTLVGTRTMDAAIIDLAVILNVKVD